MMKTMTMQSPLGLVSMLGLSLVLSACGASSSAEVSDEGAKLVDADEKADGVATTSTYYWARRDLRKCSSPRCGGYFVARVNKTSTKCADGQWAPECYVSAIDFGQLAGDGAVLVRGSITANATPYAGTLAATEAYTEVGGDGNSFGSTLPEEPFYRLSNRGLRCAKAPCPSWHRAKLNQTYSSNFDEVDMAALSLSAEQESAAWDALFSGGLYATGYIVYHGAASGRSFEPAHLFAAAPSLPTEPQPACTTDADCPQIYCITTPCPSYTCVAGACVMQAAVPTPRTCYVGGCSGQLCSDTPGRISTCVWRPEYACYQGASCTQQADGECGWTQTAELTACLSTATN